MQSTTHAEDLSSYRRSVPRELATKGAASRFMGSTMLHPRVKGENPSIVGHADTLHWKVCLFVEDSDTGGRSLLALLHRRQPPRVVAEWT